MYNMLERWKPGLPVSGGLPVWMPAEMKNAESWILTYGVSEAKGNPL